MSYMLSLTFYILIILLAEEYWNLEDELQHHNATVKLDYIDSIAVQQSNYMTGSQLFIDQYPTIFYRRYFLYGIKYNIMFGDVPDCEPSISKISCLKIEKKVSTQHWNSLRVKINQWTKSPLIPVTERKQKSFWGLVTLIRLGSDLWCYCLTDMGSHQPQNSILSKKNLWSCTC